jgi:hypothetical protein
VRQVLEAQIANCDVTYKTVCRKAKVNGNKYNIIASSEVLKPLNRNTERDPISMATSDTDDLYSGYNEYPSALSTKDLEQDEIFQQALRTSYGRRPVVSFGPGF